MTRPRIDLPRHAWRALHSAFMDWLLQVPSEISHAMMNRLGSQVTFQHWLLAIHHYRLLDVYVRVDEADQVRVGIRVPVTNGDDWLLFDLTGDEAGVDPDWLMTAGRIRIDDELDQLLGSDQ